MRSVAFHQSLLVTLLLGFVCGCQSQPIMKPIKIEPRPTFAKSVEVLLVVMPDSSASVKLMARLQDIARTYSNFRFKTTDAVLLPDDDPRLAYGAPSVLLGGKDIFNEEPRPSPGLSCRVYANVVPTEDEIVTSINKMIAEQAAPTTKKAK